jgi:hypothetical protein
MDGRTARQPRPSFLTRAELDELCEENHLLVLHGTLRPGIDTNSD